jgi:acetolactate synthase-1/2/3 large subunit
LAKIKYSDYFMQCLKESGYTHCFYVAGGNSMHLLESASKIFQCIPVVHEVTAAIAAEYFNVSRADKNKAFALVTAGPGATNTITGIAGAWLESRELLVIGGQVKSTHLSNGKMRQKGIQEINGRNLIRNISKSSVTIKKPFSATEIIKEISQTWQNRKGPVFIEICIDVSAQSIDTNKFKNINVKKEKNTLKNKYMYLYQKNKLLSDLKSARKPLVLLGGGVNQSTVLQILDTFEIYQIPIACTWAGAENCGFDYRYFAGRPNHFGMRWANLFLQQSDLLIAVGTSLGFQQTGFNIEEFLPRGRIYHIDIDKNELKKSNPKNRIKINMDGDRFLKDLKNTLEVNKVHYQDWAQFLVNIKNVIPVLEDVQICKSPYLSPHSVINKVSRILTKEDKIISCSSGGTFTAMLQCFENLNGQTFLSNKGLASMGYGLAGAIGAATSQHHSRRILLFEGDGGFSQNLQELGIVKNNQLNIKIFLTSNNGYSSIRMSQKNYFGGNYLGCDQKTGLLLPNWNKICEAFGIRYFHLDSESLQSAEFLELMKSEGPVFFEILSDPEFMYLPRIESMIQENGQMVSKPLDDMYPPLSDDITRFIQNEVTKLG